MPGITESAVDEYMLSILPPRDSVLQEMEAQAAKRDIPIVGPGRGTRALSIRTADQRQKGF